LSASNAAPPSGTSFTADVNVNLTGVQGVCGPGPLNVVLGGFSALKLNFDNTKLQRVGNPVLCDANFTAILCNGTAISNTSGVVNCSAENVAVMDGTTPTTGPVCLFRVTFQNIGASVGSPATLTPNSVNGLTSMAFSAPATCGPASFSGTDSPFTPVTPVALTGFKVD
jgi:hypothetical protein